MSESRIGTLPWLEWVNSLCLVRVGTEDKRERNARQFDCFRMQEAINRVPLGATVTSSSCGMTSVRIVGRRSWATEEGSPVELMILPLGAMTSAVMCSSLVKKLSQKTCVGMADANKVCPWL